MVGLETVRASNAGLKSLAPGLVAVFVGGTSGIGEFTLRSFVQNTVSPKVYILGRNESAASQIAEEAKTLSKDGSSEPTIRFIKTDASLLKNVDRACQEIKEKEERVNLLFLTTGVLTLSGRNETSEGIDRKLALNYYSRLRFIHNLLPLLNSASSDGGLSRVVSVLAPGREGALVEDDLELKRNFSLRNAEAHAITMADLAFERLAADNPGTSFVHSNPGGVPTNAVRNFGSDSGAGSWAMRLASPLLRVLIGPLLTSPAESGERHLFAATAGRFAPRSSRRSEAEAEAEDLAVGSDGVRGSGAYLVGPKSDRVGNERLLNDLRKRGLGQKVWDHTLEVAQRATTSS